MKIARLEAVPLDTRLKTPFRFGNIVRTTSSNVLVRIVADDGPTGYGEACPVPQLTAETQESVVALVEQRVAPELVGQDARQWRPLLGRVAKRLFQASFTQAAVDMALLDLAGKALGIPVHELLGGRHRDAIKVHGSVGWDEDPERVADTAEQQAPEFRWLKLYVGTGTLHDDLGRIAAARRRSISPSSSAPDLVTFRAGARLRALGRRDISRRSQRRTLHRRSSIVEHRLRYDRPVFRREHPVE